MVVVHELMAIRCCEERQRRSNPDQGIASLRFACNDRPSSVECYHHLLRDLQAAFQISGFVAPGFQASIL